MPRILVIGNAVLDFIFTVLSHPGEDEEIRAGDLRVAPGGNAANTARVLRRLGHEVALGAVLSGHPSWTPIESELRSEGVDLAPSRRMPGMPPLSCILLHRKNGRRTIVHHRAIPEYAPEDLAPLDLAPYHWVHFESRPGPGTARMVSQVGRLRSRIPCSLEVEKPRPGIEECFPMVDAVLFSRDYVRARGHRRPEPFLDELRREIREPLLVAAWGDQGAWGSDRDGVLHHAPSSRSGRVADTIGAGDTFNAGLIDALLAGRSFREALSAACRLAGRKVRQAGFEGLASGIPR